MGSLQEQNIMLEVRKVPDKVGIYEIRMPDRSEEVATADRGYQETFSA